MAHIDIGYHVATDPDAHPFIERVAPHDYNPIEYCRLKWACNLVIYLHRENLAELALVVNDALAAWPSQADEPATEPVLDELDVLRAEMIA